MWPWSWKFTPNPVFDWLSLGLMGLRCVIMASWRTKPTSPLYLANISITSLCSDVNISLIDGIRLDVGGIIKQWNNLAIVGFCDTEDCLTLLFLLTWDILSWVKDLPIKRFQNIILYLHVIFQENLQIILSTNCRYSYVDIVILKYLVI